MPRGTPTPPRRGGPNSHPSAETSRALATQSEERSGAPVDHPWLRQVVYFCAATGLALAVLYLLRPPLLNRGPVASMSCGPCCR